MYSVYKLVQFFTASMIHNGKEEHFLEITGTHKTTHLDGRGAIEDALLFGIPAVALAVSFYAASPLLAPFYGLGEARLWSGSAVMLGLLVATAIGYIKERNPLNPHTLAERLRFTPIPKRFWFWALGGTAAYIATAAVMNAIVPKLYASIGFVPPINTAEPWGADSIPLAVTALILNVIGEEAWWRGFILPRQERRYGRSAWLINGLLWALFHAFKWWTLPAMAVVCLIIPFVAQRSRSIWPGIMSHFIVNGLGIGLRIVQLLGT